MLDIYFSRTANKSHDIYMKRQQNPSILILINNYINFLTVLYIRTTLIIYL